MRIRCPHCSSENLISVDAFFLWTLFKVKILRRKPPELNLKKQQIRCLDCGKEFHMFDI